MATATILFRVKPTGAPYGSVQTGSATLAAEDEVQLRAASYSGWQAARWEIVDYPADYPAPSGWSTAADGTYYYAANSISGLTPPPFTMPTTAQIAAGQWGKWLCRVIVTTATGTLTSDPRVGMKIVSPALNLNGIAFTEEDEFNTQRAYPGELQEDLNIIDAAALVSGGFVSSLAATRPIKVDASTGAVTASWEPNATVNNQGYGFSSCTGVANASGAVAITAGGGALTLSGSTNVTVSNLAGVGTRYVTADASGKLGATASAGASSTAKYLENDTTATNANGVPIQALASTLYFISTAAQPLGAKWTDASTDSVLDVLDLRRLSNSTAAAGIGVGVTLTSQDDAGDEVPVGQIFAAMTDATSTTHASAVTILAATAGGLGNGLMVDGDGNCTAGGYFSAGTGGFLGTALDRATAGALTFGATTATSVVVAPALTCSNGATIRKSGIATTTTTGITAQNATAATSGATVQKGPVVDSTGSAWDSDDSTSRTVKTGWYTEPRTGTTVGYRARLALDAGAGTWSDSELWYDSSDPALFGTGLVGPTFIATSNGFRLSNGTSRGGLNLSGNNVRIVASTDGVILYAGSTNRVLVESTGQQTHYLDATSYHEIQWASGRYQRTYNAEVTTTTGTALNVTAAQISPGDGSVVDIDIRAQAYEAATKDQRRWRVMGGGQVESGVASVDDATAVDDTTSDGVNTVAWNATAIASNATIIPQVQGEDLKTITWNVTVTYTVYVP